MSWLDATPDLLDVARSTLRESVMPAIPPELRYELAMAANAVAIAARELREGAAAREAERADLAALLGSDPASPPPLDVLRRRACRAVRTGDLPPEAEARLPEVLLAAVRRRLAVSNPDHLKRYGNMAG